MHIKILKVFLLAALLLWGISGCAVLPKDFDKPISHSLENTESTDLGMSVQQLREKHPEQSGILLLNDGVDAFAARVFLARTAEKSIDAQYYLLHNDLIGHLFIAELIKAAERGVRVRLLVDDMDMGGRDFGAAALDNMPNMEVRFFNPFSRNVGRSGQLVTRFGDVTRRMHNKSFTADNQLTVIGGRNIGTQYYSAGSPVDFYDLDALCLGPIVDDVSTAFDEYWNSDLAYPASVLATRTPSQDETRELHETLQSLINDEAHQEYLSKILNSTLMQPLNTQEGHIFWGKAKVVYDSPKKISSSRDDVDLHLSTQLRGDLTDVSKELLLVSPYFVPGRAGVKFLKALTEKGVKVTILTNSLASSDVRIVHAGYSRYRKALLRAGIALYELKPTPSAEFQDDNSSISGSSQASLHSKTFVLDRERVFIGSLNLDPRSVVENTEIGVVIDTEKAARLIAGKVEEALPAKAYRVELIIDKSGIERLRWHSLENGEEVVYKSDPETTFGQRFGANFLSLFPIESQL